MTERRHDAETMTIRLANRLSELERMHLSFEELQRDRALPERLVSDLAFACEEVVTNIISYGYGDEQEHTISIVIETRPGEIRMTIEDDGFAFNPLQQGDPDISLSLDERDIGGLGLFLVKRLMDEAIYVREEPFNRLILTKRND